MNIIPLAATQHTPPPYQSDTVMWEAAQKLEATFLAEMLKSAGLGGVKNSFGGGVGEDQFSSFLRDSQALEIAHAGGIGLAESLFNAMKARINE